MISDKKSETIRDKEQEANAEAHKDEEHLWICYLSARSLPFCACLLELWSRYGTQPCYTLVPLQRELLRRTAPVRSTGERSPRGHQRLPFNGLGERLRVSLARLGREIAAATGPICDKTDVMRREKHLGPRRNAIWNIAYTFNANIMTIEPPLRCSSAGAVAPRSSAASRGLPQTLPWCASLGPFVAYFVRLLLTQETSACAHVR
eukprot:2301522-Pleurochrysis_carterae.AAC.1